MEQSDCRPRRRHRPALHANRARSPARPRRRHLRRRRPTHHHDRRCGGAVPGRRAGRRRRRGAPTTRTCSTSLDTLTRWPPQHACDSSPPMRRSRRRFPWPPPARCSPPSSTPTWTGGASPASAHAAQMASTAMSGSDRHLDHEGRCELRVSSTQLDHRAGVRSRPVPSSPDEPIERVGDDSVALLCDGAPARWCSGRWAVGAQPRIGALR